MSKKKPLFYQVLGIDVKEESDRHMILRFAKEMSEQHKALKAWGGPAQLAEMGLLWAAITCLTDPVRRGVYDDVGHEMYLGDKIIAPFTEEQADLWPDLVCKKLLDFVKVEALAGATTTQMRYMIEDITKVLPTFISSDRLVELEFGVEAMAADLLNDPKYLLQRVDPGIFRFIWRAGGWAEKGRWKLGQCKPLPKKDRLLQKRKKPYLYEITLNLDYWLTATPHHRLRLLHHELAHVDLDHDDHGDPRPGTRPHDIEEMASTVAVFGAHDVHHLAIGAQMVSHRYQPSGEGDGPQLTLFKTEAA